MDMDFKTKPVIKSPAFGNYSIKPIYYTNVYKGKSYGGECVAIIVPIDLLRFEISYSYYKREVEGLPIPNSPTGSTYDISFISKQLLTSEHFIRIKAFANLTKIGLYPSVYVFYKSEFDRNDAFNYVTQLKDNINGTFVDVPANRIDIDFNIEKRFLKDKLSLNIWGKNLLTDHLVEAYTSNVSVGYPHTINRMLGCGLSYTF